MQIRPYLYFKGECQEAIELYKKAFKIKKAEIMKFSDMPPNPEMHIPETQKDWILQATIPFGDNLIRMSDSIGELNEISTDRIGIVVESTTDIVKHAFGILADEGKIKMPLQETFFSPAYGIVYDKYGVMWNLAALSEK